MRAAVIGMLLVFASACGGDDSDDDGIAGDDANTSDDDPSDDANMPVDGAAATALEACVEQTNTYRSGKGKPAVMESSTLEAYAATGAMYDHSHSPHDHFISTNGGGISFAENECPHWSVAQQGQGDMIKLVKACLKAFYDEGPGGGHYDNMMSTNTKLGCGIYVQGDDVTIIQDYGR